MIRIHNTVPAPVIQFTTYCTRYSVQAVVAKLAFFGVSDFGCTYTRTYTYMIAFPQHRLKVRDIQLQGTDITNLNNSSAMIFYAVIKTLLDFFMLLRVGGKGRGMLKLEHFRKLNAVLFCYFVYQDEI